MYLMKKSYEIFKKIFHKSFKVALRDGWSGDRNPVGARFSALVQTVSGAHHPPSYTIGTGFI